MKTDVSEESNPPTTSVNVGFGDKKRLKGFLRTNALEVTKFYKNARALLVPLVQKLHERFPLKFTFYKHLSSLSR